MEKILSFKQTKFTLLYIIGLVLYLRVAYPWHLWRGLPAYPLFSPVTIQLTHSINIQTNLENLGIKLIILKSF